MKMSIPFIMSETDTFAVAQMMDYIKDRGNPFEDSNLVPKNFKTGKLMEKSLANSLINAIEIGEKEYLTFKEQRLEKKLPNSSILFKMSRWKKKHGH